MARASINANLRRLLQVGLGSNSLGAQVYRAIVDAINHSPPTKWFRTSVKADLVAGTAGVFSWAAAGPLGRVHANQDMSISVVHAHVEVAHDSGTLSLELWRNRGQGYGSGSEPGTLTRIATCDVPAGEADGASFGFTFASDDDKVLERGDYLHLQIVGTKPSGSGWVSFVDVHFAETAT